MTYLPVKQWYLKPFGFIAKCQSKDITDQFNAGCRFYDTRVRFDGSKPIFAHGLISYKGDVMSILDTINSLAEGNKVYVRILLETSKNDAAEEAKFTDFCKEIVDKFQNITFLGGNTKYDWHVIYDFGNSWPATQEDYASSPDVNSIWKIFPRMYKRRIKESDKLLMVDFL